MGLCFAPYLVGNVLFVLSHAHAAAGDGGDSELLIYLGRVLTGICEEERALSLQDVPVKTKKKKNST